MKPRLILLAVFMAIAFMALGADRTKSAAMIERHSSAPGAEVTVIKGGDLSRYGLSEYHSLTLPSASAATADEIAAAVSADIASATDREVSYHNGRIKYAFLTMPTADDGLNRYVIYVCNPAKSGRRRVVLIDIKGKATARQLQNLIKITSK